MCLRKGACECFSLLLLSGCLPPCVGRHRSPAPWRWQGAGQGLRCAEHPGVTGEVPCVVQPAQWHSWPQICPCLPGPSQADTEVKVRGQFGSPKCPSSGEAWCQYSQPRGLGRGHESTRRGQREEEGFSCAWLSGLVPGLTRGCRGWAWSRGCCPVTVGMG